MSQLSMQPRRAWITVAFLIGALFLAGSPAAAQVKNPDTIIKLEVTSANTLEPALSYSGPSCEVIFNIYDLLYNYEHGSTTQYVPMLATEVPTRENGLISEDGLTYTIPIRKGVKFHNGAVLTPEDVEYSFERAMVMNPAGSPTWAILYQLLGVYGTRNSAGEFTVTFEQIDNAVEVEGDNVVFHLAKPSQTFMQLLPEPWCVIVNKAWLIDNGGWPGTEETWKDYNKPAPEEVPLHNIAMGCGPYKLERFEPENEVVLVRHEEYWREPAKTERILIKYIAEWSTRMLMLRNGDADIVEVGREYLSQVDTMDGVRVRKGLFMPTVHAITINQAIDPASPYIGSGQLDGAGIPPDFFSHVEIRQAFNYAFDWDPYLNETYAGSGTQATGPSPEGIGCYNPDQEVYSYDPAKAAELFKQAYDGQLWDVGFTLTGTYGTGSAERKAAFDLLRENLAAINPRFKLESVGLTSANRRAGMSAGHLPLLASDWTNDFPDPGDGALCWMHSDGYYAGTQGFGGIYDASVEEAADVTDPALRCQLYFDLWETAYQDAIDIFLVQPSAHRVELQAVKGWYLWLPGWVGRDYFYNLWKE